MARKDELVRRAEEYAQQNDLRLGEELGFGVHGIVLSAQCQIKTGGLPIRSAVKVHEQEPGYRRERDIYLRLKKHGVKKICGCRVPQLLGYNDHLWIIEMSVVTRPYVLDFAGAYLDWKPDFSEEVIADWRADKMEQFGKQWPSSGDSRMSGKLWHSHRRRVAQQYLVGSLEFLNPRAGIID